MTIRNPVEWSAVASKRSNRTARISALSIRRISESFAASLSAKPLDESVFGFE